MDVKRRHVMMRRRNGWVLCVAAAAMALGGSRGVSAAEKQTPQQAATAQAAVETRTYNVADLVRTTPDYPFESDVRPPTGWGREKEQKPGFTPPAEGNKGAA